MEEENERIQIEMLYGCEYKLQRVIAFQEREYKTESERKAEDGEDLKE